MPMESPIESRSPRSRSRVAAFALSAPRLLRHRRGLRDGAVHLDDEVPQHGVAEAERAGQLLERLAAALDVQQNVVRLVHLGDGKRELAPAPVFEAVDGAAVRGDQAAIPLDHGGNLLTLVGMDQEYDLVMPHLVLLVVYGPPLTRLRWGKEKNPGGPGQGARKLPDLLGFRNLGARAGAAPRRG